jgi:hypothetical protein
MVTTLREAPLLLLLAETSTRLPEKDRGAPCTKLLLSRVDIWLLRCWGATAAAGSTPIAAATILLCHAARRFDNQRAEASQSGLKHNALAPAGPKCRR